MFIHVIFRFDIRGLSPGVAEDEAGIQEAANLCKSLDLFNLCNYYFSALSIKLPLRNKVVVKLLSIVLKQYNSYKCLQFKLCYLILFYYIAIAIACILCQTILYVTCSCVSDF